MIDVYFAWSLGVAPAAAFGSADALLVATAPPAASMRCFFNTARCMKTREYQREHTRSDTNATTHTHTHTIYTNTRTPTAMGAGWRGGTRATSSTVPPASAFRCGYSARTAAFRSSFCTAGAVVVASRRRAIFAANATTFLTKWVVDFSSSYTQHMRPRR